MNGENDLATRRSHDRTIKIAMRLFIVGTLVIAAGYYAWRSVRKPWQGRFTWYSARTVVAAGSLAFRNDDTGPIAIAVPPDGSMSPSVSYAISDLYTTLPNSRLARWTGAIATRHEVGIEIRKSFSAHPVPAAELAAAQRFIESAVIPKHFPGARIAWGVAGPRATEPPSHCGLLTTLGEWQVWNIARIGLIGLYAIVLCAAPIVSYRLYRRWRTPRGTPCRKCGYDLKGLTLPTCPECGSAVRLPT